jgi:hypothetical protein
MPVSDAASGYRPPALLRDVLLLNLLELTGSTQAASRHLALSQPSVSRRYRRLARDFGLRRDLRLRWGFRYGSSGSIRHLRLAARAHRIAAGQVVLGTDPWHRPLLEGVGGLLLPPPCFRPAGDWTQLLREGVVDGALVPALDFEHGNRPGPGVRLVDLGELPLALVAPLGGKQRTALAPSPEQAPGMVRLLEAHGLTLQAAPRQVQDWGGWLALLEPGGAGLPVPGPLAAAVPASTPVPLEPLPGEAVLREKLWLLLAEDLVDLKLETRIRSELLQGRDGTPDPCRDARSHEDAAIRARPG